MDDGRSRPLDLPLSNRLIGHAAAVMFFICGVVSMLSAMVPMAPGANENGVLTVGLVPAMVGVLVWFLYSHFLIATFAWIGVGPPHGAATRFGSRLAAACLIPLWASDHQRLPTVSWVG
jgi:hypothetical protein